MRDVPNDLASLNLNETGANQSSLQYERVSKDSPRYQESVDPSSGPAQGGGHERRISGVTESTADADADSDAEDSDFEDQLLTTLPRHIYEHLKLAEYESAEKLLKKILSIRHDIYWQWNLVECLEQQAKWKEVITLLESMGDADPRVQHRLAGACFNQINFEKAKNCCMKALKARKKMGKDQEYYKVMGTLADVLAAMGNGAEGDAYVGVMLKNGYEKVPCDFRTALYRASNQNKESVVGRLLDLGAVVDAKTSKKLTALYGAIYNGHDSVVRLLLERGASPDLDCAGYTPLCNAARWGHRAIIKLLIEKRADVNLVTRKETRTPLATAARNGFADCVKLLLDSGASQVKKPGSSTPLYLASMGGHEDVVSLLLARGEGPDQKSLGWTPLWTASNKGNEGVVRILLNNGANPNEISGESETIALYTAAYSGFAPIVMMLLEKGAEVNMTIGAGYTPLYAASRQGNDAIAAILIERGAVLDNSDRAKSPLRVAVENKHEAVVRVLLKSGAQVDKSLLSDAQKSGKSEIVEMVKDAKYRQRLSFS